MTITNHPLHGSGRALLTHPALALGDDAKSSQRIRVMNSRRRQPAVNQTAHSFPLQPRLLATPPQRAIPVTSHVKAKRRQRLLVRGNPVIAVVPFDHRAQPLADFGHSLVHSFAQFRFPVTNCPSYKWRAVFYYWGGGTVAQTNKYDPPAPRTTACGPANCGDDSVTVARQMNSTLHHAFGYAYAITGDPQYRILGDDMFGASFGDGTDTIKNLAADAGAKEYDQTYRASGRYLVWRLGGTPTPTPTPTPTTTPTPT